MLLNWGQYYMDLAAVVATKSKDPSTKVGAVIADSQKRLVSVGFNGFPRGVKDDAHLYEDREQKLLRVLHAEANAILFARRDLTGCKLFCTMHPCSHCAGLIIQSGIDFVRCPAPDEERWGAHYGAAKQMFREAHVRVAIHQTKEK